MFILIPVVLVVAGTIAVTALLVNTRHAGAVGRLPIESDQSADVATQVAHARKTMAVALLAYLLIGFTVTLDPLRWQPSGWFGLGQSFGIATAAIAAILIVAIRPLASWSLTSGPRTADLKPRTGGSFGPRWGFTVPIVSAVFLVSFLVVTGLLSTPDMNGLYREFTIATDSGSNSGSPYPGWFYGLPITGATTLLAVTVLFALHRVAVAPRPTTGSLFDIDDALRRSLTRFVMLLSTSALFLYFGAFALVAGIVTSNVANQWSPSPDWRLSDDGVVLGGELISTQLQPAFAAGIVEAVVGLALVILSVVLVVASVMTARVRWSTLIHESEAVDA